MKKALFSERLSEALNISEMKQADLAQKTGINKGLISRYVNGEVQPVGENLVKIAKALGVSPFWFYELDQEQKTEEREENKMITVKSIEEAWHEANKRFPTDYEKDERASQCAGYPIYMSTAEGENSWISDLNDCLELNIHNKETGGIDSIRINIESEPQIIVCDNWSSSEIRNMCIENDLYDCGSIKEYSEMLEFIEKNDPTDKNIYRVAANIIDHTSPDFGRTITGIMSMIRNDVVKTVYTLQKA
jgi:transcriptional regulator with XRE-family HTH domain